MNVSKLLRFVGFGFLFILFHININQFDLIPDWIGYLLFYLAVKEMNSDFVFKTKLDICVIIFMVYEIVSWILAIFGSSMNIPMIIILLNILSVYIEYMILTGVMDLGVQRIQEIKKNRDINLKLDIIFVVFYVFALLTASEALAVLNLILGIIMIVFKLIIVIQLFQVANQEEKLG